MESVKAIMLGKYKMKDLGKIHLILGCEVLYDEATGDYSMNQRHYVIDLCKKSMVTVSAWGTGTRPRSPNLIKCSFLLTQ